MSYPLDDGLAGCSLRRLDETCDQPATAGLAMFVAAILLFLFILINCGCVQDFQHKSSTATACHIGLGRPVLVAAW
jgi:hypothetical protein